MKMARWFFVAPLPVFAIVFGISEALVAWRKSPISSGEVPVTEKPSRDWWGHRPSGFFAANQYDHIVVGAGIIGSWTAYHLAKRGKSVLLLDQFPLPHNRGSSSGQSRGIDLDEAVQNIPLILESYPWWRKLEREVGESLFEYHDLLTVTETEGGWPITEIEKTLNLTKTRTMRRILDPKQLEAHYPDIKFPNATAALVDGSAATLLASKILESLRTQIKQHGGEVKNQCQVVRIDPGEPTSVQCRRGREKFFAESIVIAAGGWTGKLLRKVGLDVKISSTYAAFVYFPLAAPTGMATVAETSVVHYGPRMKFGGWVQPEVEYPGLVKVGVDLWIPIDPDRRDLQDPFPMRELAVQYVKNHFPQCINDTIALFEASHYYTIEDKQHIISRHPYFDNIIVGAAAGSSFKLAPVFSEALADLAMRQQPKMDISGFSLDRFGNRFRNYVLDRRSG